MEALIILGVGILGAGLLIRQLVGSAKNSACAACGQTSACSSCGSTCQAQCRQSNS